MPSPPLILLGYWFGEHDGRSASLPRPESMVDPDWNPEARDVTVAFLEQGFVYRAMMGYSSCRFCGRDNGNLELSDGKYAWPQGLAHYLIEHAVRLPQEFVDHAERSIDELESRTSTLEWWLSRTTT